MKVWIVLNKRITEGVFFVFLFIGLFLFFSYAHSLVPYDGDDWLYLAGFREPYPIWGAWNPSKVLPETIMPLCGFLAAYFFRPVIGDYVSSITICAALIVSIGITVYFYFFYRLIEKKFRLPFSGTLSIVFFILLLHFTIFQSNDFNNIHMFYSINLTCYFFYTLPALVNAILVLYLFGFNNFLVEADIAKNGFIILAFYLAIFSNIYHSVMLSIYIFVQLVSTFFNNKDKQRNFSLFSCKDYINMNCKWFIVIAVWIISLIFEANGGRANQIGHSVLSLPVQQTLLYLKDLVIQTSVVFVIIFYIILWQALVIYKKSTKNDYIDSMYRDMVIQCGSCFVLVLVYAVLVSANAFPHYIGKAEVAISFLFYLFIMLSVSLAYIFQRRPVIMKLLPCIGFMLLVNSFNSGRHFKESNIPNIAPRKCVLVDNNLINQIVEADKAGKNKMVLVVPKGDNKDNWPHPIYMGYRISNTLYSHGIVSQIIDISVKPEESLNEEFHLENKQE